MKANENKTRRNIIIFSIIVVSCGWIGRLVDMQVGVDENGSLGQLIWIVSPLLTMVVMRSWMGDGWKDFGIKPRIQGNVLLYVLSILFFPVLTVVIVGISLGMGWADLTGTSSSYFIVFAMALLPNLLKNIFEEFAWRGYMAPRLFTLGYNRFLIHIAVGLVWGAWHFPYLFLFMDTTESMFTFIPRILIGVVAMAIVYGEILLLTKSVWPAVIMHTVGNAFINTLILEKYLHIDEKFSFVASPSPEGILAIALTGLTGLWIYRKRIRIGLAGNKLPNDFLNDHE